MTDMTLPEPVREALDGEIRKALIWLDAKVLTTRWWGYVALRDHIATLTAERDALAQRCAAAERALLDCEQVAGVRGQLGVPDCIDNDGQPYQSEYLHKMLAAIHQETRHAG